MRQDMISLAQSVFVTPIYFETYHYSLLNTWNKDVVTEEGKMPNFTLSATEHVRMIGEHFLNFIGYLNADDEALESGVLHSVVKDKIY